MYRSLYGKAFYNSFRLLELYKCRNLWYPLTKALSWEASAQIADLKHGGWLCERFLVWFAIL